MTVRWSLSASVDTRPFERAVAAASVVVAWDDGRGLVPWYQARPGAIERALRADCVRLLGPPAAIDLWTGR